MLLASLGRLEKTSQGECQYRRSERRRLIFKDYCHIGIAVDTEAGLIVPVLRDVDKKNLLQISRDLHNSPKKPGNEKSAIEELQGGTFTISNQGSIGGSHFTPIIYAPQVAILGVGQGRGETGRHRWQNRHPDDAAALPRL